MMRTLAGMIMEVNFDVPWNVLFPMLDNWDPVSNIIDVKLVASLNAFIPMLVTPAGMVMEVKLDAPKNAESPKLVYPEITTFDILLPFKLALVTTDRVSSPVPINAL